MVNLLVLGCIALFFVFCIYDYLSKYVGYNPNTRVKTWWRGFVKRHIVDADPWEHEDHGATRYAQDYVDWSKVPNGYDWVAMDGEGIFGSSNFVLWAYKPLKDEKIIIMEDMGWLMWSTESGRGKVVDCTDAISGPLPPWRESLRKRPTNTHYTCACGYKAGDCSGVCSVCGNNIESKNEGN